MVENSLTTGFLDFGRQLVVPLIDTYLVVLLTIDQFCGKNLVLNKKTLLRELHTAFKVLYINDGAIPYLSSCIEELVKTALERFIEKGFLESQTYMSNNGSQLYYISSPVEAQQEISSLIVKVSAQRNWTDKSKTIIQEEIEHVIMRTRDPLYNINDRVAKL